MSRKQLSSVVVLQRNIDYNWRSETGLEQLLTHNRLDLRNLFQRRRRCSAFGIIRSGTGVGQPAPGRLAGTDSQYVADS
jgi:hypothetical protein